MSNQKINKLIDEIKDLKVSELIEVVKGLFELPVGEPQQTEFTVTLLSAGAAKLAVIRQVRELTGVGLKQAKEIVEAAPIVIKERIAKAEAEDLAARLRDAGATVEIH